MAQAETAPARRDDGMTAIVIAGSIALAIAFGVRSIFGGVLDPLSTELGWAREVFSFSLAIQNLTWGLAQPIFGIVADRYGDRPALWAGLAFYVAGMAMTAMASTAGLMHLGAGLLVGAGISGTAFGLVLSVVGRAAPPEKRSQYLGLVAALGALGQVVFPLIAGPLIEAFDWRVTIWVVTLALAPIAICIPFLKAPAPAPETPAQAAAAERSILQLITGAFATTSYTLLTLGFFVCGFHIAFITVHFPAFVTEMCGDPALGLQAIAVVGFMNVLGTLAAGQLGAMFPKQYVLSAIYALRALVILTFISFPITPLSVILFAMAIGPLWLSTVPLTSGLVAGMFGPKHMATLYGFVFLSHQLGSFAGVWLGGVVYDAYQSYDLIWWTAIGLGVFSAIVHLPVREQLPEAAPA